MTTLILLQVEAVLETYYMADTLSKAYYRRYFRPINPAKRKAKLALTLPQVLMIDVDALLIDWPTL